MVDSIKDYVQIELKTSRFNLERIQFVSVSNKEIKLNKTDVSYTFYGSDKNNIIIESSYPRYKREEFSYDDLHKPTLLGQKCFPSKQIVYHIPNYYSSVELNYHYNFAHFSHNSNRLNPNLNLVSLPSFLFQYTKNFLINSPCEFYLGTGIGTTNFNFQSSISGHEDIYDDEDIDGSLYRRHVHFTEHDELVKLRYFTIPVSLGLSTNLNKLKYSFLNEIKLISICLISIIFANKHKKIPMPCALPGIYPELFNIQIQENGVYDFGFTI